MSWCKQYYLPRIRQCVSHEPLLRMMEKVCVRWSKYTTNTSTFSLSFSPLFLSSISIMYWRYLFSSLKYYSTHRDVMNSSFCATYIIGVMDQFQTGMEFKRGPPLYSRLWVIFINIFERLWHQKRPAQQPFAFQPLLPPFAHFKSLIFCLNLSDS